MQTTGRGITAIILSLLFLCSGPALRTSAQEVRAAVTTAFPPYVYVPAHGAEAALPLADSLFHELALPLRFRVNRVDLPIGTPQLRHLTDSVLPQAASLGFTFRGLDLRGGASPEGPYANNVRLSRGRAALLQRLLSSRLPADSLAASTITTTVPEDYAYLLWLLERDGDGAAPVVRRLIKRHGANNGPAIKASLQKVAGGRMWERLLRDYFPRLRAARVVVLLERPAAPAESVAVSPVSPACTRAESDASLADALAPQQAPGPLQVSAPRRHLLALSTNLLYDAFYMPGFGWAPMLNIQAEYFPSHGRFSFLAGFTGPYYHRWSRHKFFQIRDYHLEVRRWLRPGERHTGAYAALYANANKYGIGLSATRGWQGEGIGGALKIGYVIPLGSGRWRLDFHVAAGGYYTRFDPYRWGNPVTGEVDGDYYYDYTGPLDLFSKRRYRRWWIGPTEVGVSLSFDLLYRRRCGHGASLRRKEVWTP